MISSCKDCKERFIGCHGVCETYIQQRNEYLLRKEQVLKAKKNNALFEDYITESIQRQKRKRGIK